MTRSEAEQQAQRLQAEHPERTAYRFFAQRSSDGDWQVAKVRLPEHLRRGPLTTTIDTSPRPARQTTRNGCGAAGAGLPGGVW
jgi:hypothetical protein